MSLNPPGYIKIRTRMHWIRKFPSHRNFRISTLVLVSNQDEELTFQSSSESEIFPRTPIQKCQYFVSNCVHQTINLSCRLEVQYPYSLLCLLSWSSSIFRGAYFYDKSPVPLSQISMPMGQCLSRLFWLCSLSESTVPNSWVFPSMLHLGHLW